MKPWNDRHVYILLTILKHRFLNTVGTNLSYHGIDDLLHKTYAFLSHC